MHDSNASSSIVVNDECSSNVTSINDEQLKKALNPIFVIDETIFIFVIDLHPLKAISSISVTEGGIVICFNEWHSVKAWEPIVVIEGGIIVSFNDLQPMNV